MQGGYCKISELGDKGKWCPLLVESDPPNFAPGYWGIESRASGILGQSSTSEQMSQPLEFDLEAF